MGRFYRRVCLPGRGSLGNFTHKVSQEVVQYHDTHVSLPCFDVSFKRSALRKLTIYSLFDMFTVMLIDFCHIRTPAVL